MKKKDARSLSSEQQKLVRIKAVDMAFEHDYTQRATAAALDVSRTHINRWSLKPIQLSLYPLLFFLVPTVQSLGSSLRFFFNERPGCSSRRRFLFSHFSPLRGRPRFFETFGIFFFFAGFSRPTMAVESRLRCPQRRLPRCSSTNVLWMLAGSSRRANSSKARENTLSCGIPETLSQPHSRRRLGLDEI